MAVELKQQQRQVMLDSAAFQRALATYVDDNKQLDPMVRRQLEGWTLEWNNINNDMERSDDTTGDDDDETSETVDRSIFESSSQQNLIRGTLTIEGDYVSVTLLMECSWTHQPGDSSENTKTKSDGILNFSCRIDSAKLLDKGSSSSNDDSDKADRKIRKKMMQRLRQDSYIAKILALKNEQEQPSSQDLCLAKARVHVHQAKNILEERVDASETVAEAIRRSVWSSADSSLDVIEVILALPSLPGTLHKDYITATTPLANRAKLRLLEDAMLDECEKEGEGELIQELSIGQREGHEDKNNAAKKGFKESHSKKKKSKR
ncbi:MAG: hypothetical protein SGILL_008786 [Bacillariaceae sp.]